MCCLSSLSGAPASTIEHMGAGEKAPRLKLHTVLPEDQGSIPTTSIAAHTVTPVPKDPLPSSGLHRHQYTNIGAGKHACMQNKI